MPASVPRSTPARKKKLSEIYDRLLAAYGPQKCFLSHGSPFQLLIATILSAQCTDKMVNRVTEPLFEKYSTPEDFAVLSSEQLEPLIHACGYYRAKAKNILGASKSLVERFGSKVPHTMEELTSLPGVGRKTANVVLSDALDHPGLPVDTHVKRISNLLGIAHSPDPEKIEAELCANLAPERWGEFSHLLIILGRRQCPAGRPKCAGCPLEDLCEYARKNARKRGIPCR